MDLMKRMRKIWTMILVAALLVTGVQTAPAPNAQAAKKMKLSKKKLTLKAGQSKKLTIKNKKGKVTWKSSKKKIAKVSKKGVVKALKAGKTVITATIKYKKKTTKLKCKVTVTKKKAKKTNAPTKKPVTNPTKKPTTTEKPAATQKPVTTEKPAPAVTPDLTAAVEWDEKKNGEFSLDSIQFEDSSLTYQMGTDAVYLDIGDKASVKEAVPDMSKCRFDVTAGDKHYDVYKVTAEWNSKSFYQSGKDQGYYNFRVYIQEGSALYYSDFKLAELKSAALLPNADTKFRLDSVTVGEKEWKVTQDARDAAHFMVDLPADATMKTMLPDPEKAVYTVYYKDKKVQVEKVKNVTYVKGSYYEAESEGTGYYKMTFVCKSGQEEIVRDIELSAYSKTLEVYSYSIDGKKAPGSGFNDIFEVAVPEGKTLKDVYPDMKTFSFDCVYRGVTYDNIKVSNPVWTGESWYEDKWDGGYYTFHLTITADGKEITREFYLVEEYQETAFSVSGRLKSGDGAYPEGEELIFVKEGTKVDFYELYEEGSDAPSLDKAVTGEKGAYQIDLPEGTYDIYWNSFKVGAVTVEDKAVTQDIAADTMYPVSGTVTRLSKPWCNIKLYIYGNGDSYCRLQTDEKTGAYSLYLPKGNYSVSTDDIKVGELALKFKEGQEICNINSNCIQISGTIFKNGSVALANQEFELRYDEYVAQRVKTDGDGKYLAYVEADREYQYYYGDDLMFGTLEASKEDVTKDVTMGVSRITGKLKTASGKVIPGYYFYLVNSEDEEIMVRTDEDGVYSEYLKPGTYGMKFPFEEAAAETLTVGDTDAVYHIQSSLHEVKGGVYNNEKNWSADLRVKSKENGEWHWLHTDETADGTYNEYLPAGTYTVYYVGAGEEKGIEITVLDEDITKDLMFELYMIKTQLYSKEGEKLLEGDSYPELHISDADGNDLGGYGYVGTGNTIYVAGPGEYKVVYKNKVIDTIQVTESETNHDIVCSECGLYQVSGKVTGLRGDTSWGNPLTFCDEEGTEFYSDYGEVNGGTMPYSIWLSAGTYTVSLMMNEEWEESVEISGTLVSQDFALPPKYLVSGKLSLMNGVMGEKYITIYKKEDSDEIWYGSTYSDTEGTYEMYLPTGTYRVETDGLEAVIEVGTEDITGHDINFPYISMRGKLLQNGKTPMADGRFDVYQKNGETLESGHIYWCDESGNYQIYLESGKTYTIKYDGDITLADNVAAGEQDIEQDLILNATKVSGIVTYDSQADTDMYSVEVCDENFMRVASLTPDMEGGFSIYLPKGTYYMITVKGMLNIPADYSEIPEGRKIKLVVGEDDMTQNLAFSLQ